MDNVYTEFMPYLPNTEEMARLNKEALEKIENLANEYKKLEAAYGDYVFKVLENIREESS